MNTMTDFTQFWQQRQQAALHIMTTTTGDSFANAAANFEQATQAIRAIDTFTTHHPLADFKRLKLGCTEGGNHD